MFRVAVALVLLADLAMRAPDLVDHYTDAGILPRASLAAHPMGRFLPWVSLHLAHGSAAWAGGLFALAALCALALLVGYRSRAAAFASWLLLVSLQNRNPLVVYGGDNFLVVVLFWCPFLPLGARASLDARLGRGSAAERVFSPASAGLLVQIAAVHFFSAFHKRGAEWLAEGSAVWYALHVENLVRPLGVLLREHDTLLVLATWGTLALESVGSLALFSPWRSAACRQLAAAAFAAFHLGLALCLRLLLFNWMGAAFMAVFLPAEFWARVAPGWSRGSGRTRPLSRPAAVAAASALGFVLFWNAVGLRTDWQEAVEREPALAPLVAPGLLLRLGQRWFMFSPHPPRYTHWNVAEGVLADGRRVDLLRGGAATPDFSRPAAPGDYYPSGRWERVFANAWQNPYVDAYASLAGYWCRRGSFGSPPARLEQVRIWARREENRRDGPPRLEPPRQIARFSCADLATPARAR